MAVSSAGKMDDLEDGEISGSESESEMGVVAEGRIQPSAAPAFGGLSFQSRAPAQAAPGISRAPAQAAPGISRAPAQAAPGISRAPAQAAPGISSCHSGSGSDSSTSESDSDEDAGSWKRKRQKHSHALLAAAAALPTPAPTRPLGRRVNNIWGSVVQEQSQEAVAAELGIMGMEGGVSMSSRQCETYNYLLARKLAEKERQQSAGHEEVMLDCQLEEYMQHGGEENGGHLKRKRPVKERLGPRAEMDFKGRYEITENDPDDKVTDEIAHRLMEPKKDLIERVVKVIGKKKAIELLSETATVEQCGGLFTVDGSRRRTPGGVFLNLLKNTPSISSEQVKEIFYDENQKDYSNKKAAKKRRRHEVSKKMKQALNTLNLQEDDDVSRETFASDTNEALESLEEPPEGQPEPAHGTEDTPVVYTSSDLEVF